MNVASTPLVQRSAAVVSGLIGAQLVLHVVVWVIGAAALSAMSPVGVTVRSARLADATELLVGLIGALLVCAFVALAVWDRAARRVVKDRGRSLRRPPTAALLLLVIPPVGLTWIVFHELRELWSATREGPATDDRPRALHVWISTYVLALASARFALPPDGGHVDHVRGFLLGYLSIAAVLAITSGLGLAVTVLRTTERLGAPVAPVGASFPPTGQIARLTAVPGRS